MIVLVDGNLFLIVFVSREPTSSVQKDPGSPQQRGHEARRRLDPTDLPTLQAQGLPSAAQGGRKGKKAAPGRQGPECRHWISRRQTGLQGKAEGFPSPQPRRKWPRWTDSLLGPSLQEATPQGDCGPEGGTHPTWPSSSPFLLLCDPVGWGQGSQGASGGGDGLSEDTGWSWAYH